MAVSVSERGHIWETCKGRLGKPWAQARLGEPRGATPWSLDMNNNSKNPISSKEAKLGKVLRARIARQRPSNRLRSCGQRIDRQLGRRGVR